MTVAVVDGGCDASHPDLADHVVHNVKVYSGEYANVRPDGSNTIVVANEVGPYQNTDAAGGHGTHVAGIIAADSTTAPDGSRLGVAPDAELVCYSIGEVLFTTAVVAAYDHLLDQPDLWSVDVVNNSWGTRSGSSTGAVPSPSSPRPSPPMASRSSSRPATAATTTRR